VTNSDPLATLLEGVGVPNVELPTSPRYRMCWLKYDEICNISHDLETRCKKNKIASVPF